MTPVLGIDSRRGAYVALVILTLMWGSNWMAIKIGVEHSHPVIFNIERILAAIVVLFVAMLIQGRKLWPESWMAVIVTGLFQTTLNFGATTMAVATGGIGRSAVLVFTMPFWTLLMAWPVLGERVRGTQWLAVALALAGITLMVEPWDWHGDLEPKLWATLSGFGWAAGSVFTAYFQRRRRIDGLTLITWQMVTGVVPLCLIPLFIDAPFVAWTPDYAATILYAGALSSGVGFILWTVILAWLPAWPATNGRVAPPSASRSSKTRTALVIISARAVRGQS